MLQNVKVRLRNVISWQQYIMGDDVAVAATPRGPVSNEDSGVHLNKSQESYSINYLATVNRACGGNSQTT